MYQPGRDNLLLPLLVLVLPVLLVVVVVVVAVVAFVFSFSPARRTGALQVGEAGRDKVTA